MKQHITVYQDGIPVELLTAEEFLQHEFVRVEPELPYSLRQAVLDGIDDETREELARYGITC